MNMKSPSTKSSIVCMSRFARIDMTFIRACIILRRGLPLNLVQGTLSKSEQLTEQIPESCQRAASSSEQFGESSWLEGDTAQPVRPTTRPAGSEGNDYLWA